MPIPGVYGDQLPCELAYISKIEQSCQLAKRVQNLIQYISERCDILVKLLIMQFQGRLSKNICEITFVLTCEKLFLSSFFMFRE
jgi:hypothetical protein